MIVKDELLSKLRSYFNLNLYEARIWPALIRKAEALKPLFQKLNKKGVAIKIAAPISKESVNVVKDLKNLADIRDSKDFNARFVIVDGKDLMFMVMHDEAVHPSYDIDRKS